MTIDFHLGSKLRVFSHEGLNTIDTKYTTKEDIESSMRLVELKQGQPFILTEHDFVIATTKERLTLPDNIVGHLHGKSSLARLGVVVHSTAARFDPGWHGRAVMELGNLGVMPVVLYAGMRVCALTFETLSSPCEITYLKKKGQKYGKQTFPRASKINEEFKK